MPDVCALVSIHAIFLAHMISHVFLCPLKNFQEPHVLQIRNRQRTYSQAAPVNSIPEANNHACFFPATHIVFCHHTKTINSFKNTLYAQGRMIFNYTIKMVRVMLLSVRRETAKANQVNELTRFDCYQWIKCSCCLNILACL